MIFYDIVTAHEESLVNIVDVYSSDRYVKI